MLESATLVTGHFMDIVIGRNRLKPSCNFLLCQPIHAAISHKTSSEIFVRCKFFTAVTILMMFFCVKSPCGLVGRSQRFGEARCVHLQNFGPEYESESKLFDFSFYLLGRTYRTLLNASRTTANNLYVKHCSRMNTRHVRKWNVFASLQLLYEQRPSNHVDLDSVVT
jgi:hypothetical protein